MRQQGQGAQEVRVRQQGVGGAALERPHHRGALVPQRVRRAHCGEVAQAGGKGIRAEGQGACGRPRLQGAGEVGGYHGHDPGHAKANRFTAHQGKEAQTVPEAGGHRAGHRALQVGPPPRAQLLQGSLRRLHQRHARGRRIQLQKSLQASFLPSP